MLPRLYGDGPQDLCRIGCAGAAGAAGICGLAALIVFLTGRRLMAMVPALAAALILFPLLTAGVGPRLSQFWVSAAAGRAGRKRSPGLRSAAGAGGL